MALRDQPYLPLYIKDFMTDEDLVECSASSIGVYIMVMCVLHKGKEYGKLLLNQKYKQTDKQIKNFALQLVRHLPFDLITVEEALNELITEGVLNIEDDYLIQERMVKDGKISEARSKAGSKGGKTTQSKGEFAKAKTKQNTANAIEYVNEYDIEVNTKEKGIVKGKNKIEKINFGDYVTLTQDEYDSLTTKHGNQATDWMINKLDNYKASSGKKYKSDYRAILSWVVDDYNKKQASTPKEYKTASQAFRERLGMDKL